MQLPGNKSFSAAYMGLTLALALIMGYVETLIPFDFGVPGIKLGLPNLVTVFLMYSTGFTSAITVNLLRILLSGLLFGNMSMIIYSLSGAIFSFVCMLLVKKTDRFSPVGVSIVGGVSHNAGQLFIACMALGTKQILLYAPVLMISGAAAGGIMGLIADRVIKHLSISGLFKKR